MRRGTQLKMGLMYNRALWGWEWGRYFCSWSDDPEVLCSLDLMCLHWKWWWHLLQVVLINACPYQFQFSWWILLVVGEGLYQVLSPSYLDRGLKSALAHRNGFSTPIHEPRWELGRGRLCCWLPVPRVASTGCLPFASWSCPIWSHCWVQQEGHGSLTCILMKILTDIRHWCLG